MGPQAQLKTLSRLLGIRRRNDTRKTWSQNHKFAYISLRLARAGFLPYVDTIKTITSGPALDDTLGLFRRCGTSHLSARV